MWFSSHEPLQSSKYWDFKNFLLNCLKNKSIKKINPLKLKLRGISLHQKLQYFRKIPRNSTNSVIQNYT